MTRLTTIYALCHPVTCEIRYIGKTVDIKTRMKDHFYRKRKNHKSNWISSLPSHPIIVELETVRTDWIEAEQFWIRYFRYLGARLLNKTAGGEGALGLVMSDTTKRKLAEINTGKKQSEETKRKRAESLRGRKRPAEVGHKISATKKGWKPTEEQRKNMSDSHKGYKQSEEQKAKYMGRTPWNKGVKMPDTWVNPMGMLGKKHSQETKKKMSEAHQVKVISESQKELIRAAKLGTKASVATRKKLSDSHKGIIPTEETRKRLSDAVRLSWVARREKMAKKGAFTWT